MFDDVTRREGGRRAARRARYLAASLAVQAAALALAAFLTLRPRAPVEGPVVPVAIVRPSAVGGPALRPPALGRAGVPGPTAPPRPGAETTRQRPKTRRALAQPKAPPGLAPAPAPAPEPAQLPADRGDGHTSDGVADGGREGVGGEAGVAGGVAGAVPPGAGGAAEGYATSAGTRPVQARRNCVQDSVRIPQGMQGFASGPIKVRFAVGPDGAPGEFEVLGTLPDPGIGTAIWRAIQQCRWVPGTDGQGRPAKMWVTMPIRFVRG